MRSLSFAAVALFVLPLAGCPGKGGSTTRPHQLDSAGVLAKLAAARAQATAFSAESVMDYWLGSDRVKGEVWVMGKPGAKVRFNALSPAGGDPMADMACDGTNFVYVDKQNNCQLTGPCNDQSIAQLLRVPLAPDDFFFMALGQTPVIGASANLRWDAKRGREIVEIADGTRIQTITIDVTEGRWDVEQSELRNVDGTIVWAVEHTDFEPLTSADGAVTLRVPGKSRFKSPDDKADLLVEWNQRVLNPTLDDAKFVLAAPEGIPACAQ